MKSNVGNTDRVIRVVAGAALAGLGFTGVIGGWVGIVVGIVGLVFVVTGAVGFCPIYAGLRLSTRR